jgi:hypothetical protein
MKRALFAAALAFAACNNNNEIAGSGQFVGPTGLGITSVRDRDIVFVANTGRDGLRALQLCYVNDTQDDVAPSCSGNDLQFVPGPIRVFPANIETNNDHPVHLAGVRLSAAGVAPDAGNGVGNHAGVVLVVGADKNLLIVDAQNIVDAVNGVPVTTPIQYPLDGVGADVIADNLIDPNTDYPTNPVAQAGGGFAPVPAFVVTAPSPGHEAELVELNISLDANNAATAPTLVGKCTLGAVMPTRLAIAPQEAPLQITPEIPCGPGAGACGMASGTDAGPIPYANIKIPPPTSDIFVADGVGDGVVRVPRTSLTLAGGPCAMTRISAGGRSVNSIALSPQWYEGTD